MHGKVCGLLDCGSILVLGLIFKLTLGIDTSSKDLNKPI